MSVLSIALLTLALVSLIIVGKTKKLNIIIQRILFFGLFALVICCIPEVVHSLYDMLYVNWLELLFNNWFNKDAFALMVGKALAWIIIIGGIWLIVWGLWRLFLVITKSGKRHRAVIFLSILIFLAAGFAEFFNGFFTFEDKSSFFTLKTAVNAQFELLPSKVVYFSADDPVSEICQAEKYNIITDKENRARLQLKIDGDVYIFRSQIMKLN